MSLSRAVVTAAATRLQAQREILLWTTRDGREIPLDEMSCDHIANAVRVLSLWRSRLKKRGGDDDGEIVRDLATAISRFKLIERQRRKAAGRAASQEEAVADPEPQSPRAKTSNFKQPREKPTSAYASSNSSFGRRRKPVAST